MLLYFKEKGKLEYPAKTSQSKGENQYQTQPTDGIDTRPQGWGWMLSPLCHPSGAIIAKLHSDALCSIFNLISFPHLSTPCCVGHGHDVGWKCCVVFAGLYKCCTVQYRSAYTLSSLNQVISTVVCLFPAFVELLFWFSLLVYQWKLVLPLYSDM